jgi:hypothetical protein
VNSGTVVPEIVTLDEQSFHDRLVAGLARGIARMGKPQFALRIGMSTRGLDKVLGGSTPHACTIFNARAVDASVLDEVLAGYGIRLVPADAACTADDHAGVVLLRAATKCIEAEADGSKDHQELLGMEADLRASAAVHAALLARIDEIRGIGGRGA